MEGRGEGGVERGRRLKRGNSPAGKNDQKIKLCPILVHCQEL